MQGFLAASGWALLGASSLVVGAAVGFLVKLPQKVVALVMAGGAGVLISAVSFDLVGHAVKQGGLGPTAAGFLGGALLFTLADFAIDHLGGAHRTRSGFDEKASMGKASEGVGLALAAGALLDGIPESIALGISTHGGHGVSVMMLAAIFLSNLPEGLSSAAGMKRAGHSARFVFGMWVGIALLSALAAGVGHLALRGASGQVLAVINSVAAGGILAMLVDTMIPEAAQQSPRFAGLVTAAAFLLGVALD